MSDRTVMQLVAEENDFLREENAELRQQLEQAEVIQREIEAQLGCPKGNSIASIIHLKDAVRELYKSLEQTEARYTRLVTASRNAIRMWALAQNWISEKMRPTYKEWDAAMEEFEQALATSPASPQAEHK